MELEINTEEIIGHRTDGASITEEIIARSMDGASITKEIIAYSTDSAIHTEKISKVYPVGYGNKFYALRDVSVDIPKSKLTILKGRSGSGKTTLINIMGLLDKQSEGKVWLFEEEVSNMSKARMEEIRRYQMGFVFQSVALVPTMTAYENIEFALRLGKYKGNRDKRIHELMDMVGLGNRISYMAGRLSGGEQQRVAIARAVAHNPKVVFADEPTGALDTASGLAVMNIFKKLVEEEKMTIVMSTHDPNLMELGDIVYEINDGKCSRC